MFALIQRNATFLLMLYRSVGKALTLKQALHRDKMFEVLRMCKQDSSNVIFTVLS